MAVSAGFADFVKDQLAPVRSLTSGRFFGGVGLSADGVQFAMVMDHALYFVVSDATRGRYEDMGSSCFSYATKKGRVDVKKYYEVPAEFLEDQDRLLELASESIDVARKAKKSK
jgi:DNA transformation protein and related proteins